MNHIQTPQEIDAAIADAVAKALAPKLDAMAAQITAKIDALGARLDERDAISPQTAETRSGSCDR